VDDPERAARFFERFSRSNITSTEFGECTGVQHYGWNGTIVGEGLLSFRRAVAADAGVKEGVEEVDIWFLAHATR